MLNRPLLVLVMSAEQAECRRSINKTRGKAIVDADSSARSLWR